MRVSIVIAAILAFATTLAYVSRVDAGGGGAGTPIDTFALECYQINGDNPPHVLSIDDQFFPGESQRTNVQLGKAKLLCTPATVTVTSNTTVGTGFALADHLMCYEAPPVAGAPKVLKQVADPFGTQTVQVNVPRFTCVGAFKCDAGGSCPAP